MIDNGQIRLILRAQAHDRDSVEMLLGQLQKPLRTYISGIVGPTAAPDVLQETLVEVWRDLKYLREPELIRPWSYRIASRCSFKWLRRNRRFMQADNEVFPIGDIAAPDRSEVQLFITTDEFLQVLSPASRGVLVLHYLHEHSLEEVAAILEISPGTVKSRLAYGLSRLRNFINTKGVKQ